MEQIKAWYKGLQPSERILVTALGTLVALLIIYLAIIRPASTAVSARQTRVERKQQDLIWMRGMSNTVRMLEASQPGSTAGESLVVLINRTAQQAGIASAVTNQSPSGENSIRVRLEGGSFDLIVTWLGTLEQQYGVRVDSASIDRTDKVGVVNASLVLSRGSPN